MTGGFLLGCNFGMVDNSKNNSFIMPEESEPHERTWMSFVANDYIWSKRQIPEVKRNLALIARTIAKYEPVSMLVSPDDYDEAISLLEGLNSPLRGSPFAHGEPLRCGGSLRCRKWRGNPQDRNGSSHYPIQLIKFRTDDLWLRDTGPTFVKGSDGQKYAINFNFNGWGNKQEHTQDSKVANLIANTVNAKIITTNLVLEGGCFEVDGHGTAILTKSCVLNDNRNPNMSLVDVEEELKVLLGLKKIIWLEGIRGKDITDGHTDFYARFSKQGEVIVSRENYKKSYDYEVTRNNIQELKNAVDANGNKLNVVIIDTPNRINSTYGVDDFAAGYIGYYVCNNAVIMQSFGDSHADKNAKAIIAKAFPDRTIEQISINAIASGGGSIHCATQQEPKI